ncbi:hypothetical protein BC629DRAFT_188094 [Irpex lacteus]|nr:hypothetical protein BC629DRAFT_188094 [Irpex lacteus]
MTKKLKDVREVLGTMVDLMQLNHLQVLTTHVTTGRDPSAPHQHQSLPTISPISHRQIGTLQCDDDCTCRCHARSLASIIPQSLVPYVGQLFVSRQLLYPAFTLWNRCNVRTCRGTFLDPAQVSWILPGYFSMARFSLHRQTDEFIFRSTHIEGPLRFTYHPSNLQRGREGCVRSIRKATSVHLGRCR